MIAPTGYWLVDRDRVNGESFDTGIMAELVKMDVKSVYDFGCGSGKYVQGFNEAGIVATGYDGNPITGEFDNCRVLDLSKETALGQVDMVLSLEVGEHIPAHYEQVFIDNLVRATGKYLVLSWALPGQGGYGHVNEKTNEDVIKAVGLKFNQELTDRFRAASTIFYFKNTLMVFEK